jgi:NADH-quinone oxidoreductase subunit M
MTIILVMVTLMLGGIIAWLAQAWNPHWPKWVALGSCVLAGLWLAPLLLTTPDVILALGQTSSTWHEYLQYDWIPRLGISFIIGVDGLSLVMVSLTLLLGGVAILSSWNEINSNQGFFHFNLMWTLTGVVGVFTSLDLFQFFFFWEVMLVPMYFLIAIWGHEQRARAAMKFFLFTQISGLLMLVSILSLVVLNMLQTGTLTFNYFNLVGHELSANASWLIMLGFFIAFIVKLPAFPFHPWLPDAHTQAPTAASVLLAGILLKTGAYGLIRFTLPLFPEAAHQLATTAMLLGAISIVYGALLAYAQTDFKRLVAYSSVSHMGFVLLGVYAFNELALQGAVMQMVAHGLSTAALFLIAGALQQRLHTRDMTAMGGLWALAPRLGAITLFFIVASLGMPGLGNFVGEFLVLLGAFQANIVITCIATLGLVTGAAYALIAVQRVFHGAVSPKIRLSDLDGREFIALLPLLLGLVWLGVAPQPLFDLVEPMLSNVRQLVMPTGNEWLGGIQ